MKVSRKTVDNLHVSESVFCMQFYENKTARGVIAPRIIIFWKYQKRWLFPTENWVTNGFRKRALNRLISFPEKK